MNPVMVERVAKAIADKLATPGASTTDAAKAAIEAGFRAAIEATGLNEAAEYRDHDLCWQVLREASGLGLEQRAALRRVLDRNSARIIAAASGLNELRGWQPIETAPKDGTMVLFCIGGVSGTRKAWVHPGWYDAKRGPFPWAFIDDTAEAITGCCDREDEGRIEVNGCSVPPPRWMPLPEPPSEGDMG